MTIVKLITVLYLTAWFVVLGTLAFGGVWLLSERRKFRNKEENTDDSDI